MKKKRILVYDFWQLDKQDWAFLWYEEELFLSPLSFWIKISFLPICLYIKMVNFFCTNHLIINFLFTHLWLIIFFISPLFFFKFFKLINDTNLQFLNLPHLKKYSWSLFITKFK